MAWPFIGDRLQAQHQVGVRTTPVANTLRHLLPTLCMVNTQPSPTIHTMAPTTLSQSAKHVSPPSANCDDRAKRDEESETGDASQEDPPDFYAEMWDVYDGYDQPNNAREGSVQSCYWTDGMVIVRTKINGKWEYRCEDE